jgi:predicted nucleic acid-binding protein
MTRYLLDTSAVLAAPTILERWSPSARLYLPTFFWDELRSAARRDEIEELAQVLHFAAEQSVSKHFVTMVDVSDFVSAQVKRPRGLSPEDLSLLGYCKAKSTASAPLTIVTNDKALRSAATAEGVSSISSEQYIQLFPKSGFTTLSRVGKVHSIGVYLIRNLILSLLLASIGVVATIEGANRYSLILPYLTLMNLTVCGIALGILLFILRQRFRLGYAIIEIAVGVLAIRGFVGGTDGPITGTMLLSAMAGLYVIVRGLDNFMVGLSPFPLPGFMRRLLRLDGGEL